jgi:hypothetical protein
MWSVNICISIIQWIGTDLRGFEKLNAQEPWISTKDGAAYP